MAVNFADEFSAADVGDRVVNHIFGCGLTLAALVGRPDVNAEVAEQLCGVIEGLDQAVSAMRRAAFAALINDSHRNPNTSNAMAVTDPAPAAARVAAGVRDGRRRLCRFNDDAFAYAMHGHDFYRCSDHELWAHESDGLLLSARSGTPFARRDGRVFYDFETNVPLYYEDMHIEQPAGPCGTAANPAPHPLE